MILGESIHPRLTIDLGRYEAVVEGQHIVLSHRELQVLAYLLEQQGKVASRDDISHAVWGHAAESNIVAVHINRLRSKMKSATFEAEVIHTVRGVGYRLAPAFCPEATEFSQREGRA